MSSPGALGWSHPGSTQPQPTMEGTVGEGALGQTSHQGWVQSLGWEGHLEKNMATHSSTLACEIPAGYTPLGCKELDMM